MKRAILAVMLAVCCSSLTAQEQKKEFKPVAIQAVQAQSGPIFAAASQADRDIIAEVRKQIAQASDEELREANPDFWDNSWKPRRRMMRIAGSRRFLRGFKQDIADEITFNAESEPVAGAVGAIGDGAILNWLQNGGFEQLIKFILAIIEALS